MNDIWKLLVLILGCVFMNDVGIREMDPIYIYYFGTIVGLVCELIWPTRRR